VQLSASPEQIPEYPEGVPRKAEIRNLGNVCAPSEVTLSQLLLDKRACQTQNKIVRLILEIRNFSYLICILVLFLSLGFVERDGVPASLNT
jgi:hypothetical protein